MNIGILGVGHLAGYLVPGLLRHPANRVLLSPRNAARAHALAEAHGAAVAADNAALVEACEVVLLAVRPDQAAAAVAGLPWRAGQTLVSLCAGVPLARLAAARPAVLARAMPITAAALGESPTCLYPDGPESETARAALAPLGPVLPLREEAQFETATVSAGFYGWVQGLIGAMTAWQEQAGLPPETARPLVAQTVKAGAAMVLASPDKSVEALTREVCTPGGITALGLDTLERLDAFADWEAASDAVLARLRGADRT